MESLKGEEGLKTDLGMDYAKLEAEFESTRFVFAPTRVASPFFSTQPAASSPSLSLFEAGQNTLSVHHRHCPFCSPRFRHAYDIIVKKVPVYIYPNVTGT
jgi:hypothetical protein